MLYKLPKRHQGANYRAYRHDNGNLIKYSIVNIVNGVSDFLWIRPENDAPHVIDQLVHNIRMKEAEFGEQSYKKRVLQSASDDAAIHPNAATRGLR